MSDFTLKSLMWAQIVFIFYQMSWPLYYNLIFLSCFVDRYNPKWKVSVQNLKVLSIKCHVPKHRLWKFQTTSKILSLDFLWETFIAHLFYKVMFPKQRLSTNCSCRLGQTLRIHFPTRKVKYITVSTPLAVMRSCHDNSLNKFLSLSQNPPVIS